jgi:hypothetical protein
MLPFNEMLGCKLSMILDSETVDAVVDAFRSNYSQSLHSLSLEDIETIARGL